MDILLKGKRRNGCGQPMVSTNIFSKNFGKGTKPEFKYSNKILDL